MSSQSARAAIDAALAQLCDEGGPEVELCQLQTLEKSQANSVTHWFTLCKRDDNQGRVLTLLFDQTREVQYPGPAYLRDCQSRIVEEIRRFWRAETSELRREVPIP
jgi:hypothetical protein